MTRIYSSLKNFSPIKSNLILMFSLLNKEHLCSEIFPHIPYEARFWVLFTACIMSLSIRISKFENWKI